MKSCEGITVKLSEVNKITSRDGKRIQVFKCDCLRKGLWIKDKDLDYKFYFEGMSLDTCKCQMYPWRKVDGTKDKE
jgi:hypothetical protein